MSHGERYVEDLPRVAADAYELLGFSGRPRIRVASGDVSLSFGFGSGTRLELNVLASSHGMLPYVVIVAGGGLDAPVELLGTIPNPR